MNKRKRTLTAIYRWLLRLFSPHFRQEFTDEMEEVFSGRLDLAAANGRLTLLTFLLRELWGLAAGGVRQRLYVWQAWPLLVAQAGGGVEALGEHRWPWRKILFLIACLLPVLPVVVFLIGWTALRTSENRVMVNRVVLADFNGDGQQDALILLHRRYRDQPYNHMLLNEGDGRFVASDLWPQGDFAQAVALGDLNGNGHMDVVAVHPFFSGLARYLNDGSGAFIPFGLVPDRYAGGSLQNLGAGDSDRDGRLEAIVVPNDYYVSGFIQNLALGDLDGDGRLDAFVAGCCPSGEVWLNSGDGLLTSSRQRLGHIISYAVALADLNGDGSLDAFLVHGANGPNTVWFNDGQGNFNDSDQQLGASQSFAVALGDVNGDGFPDAVVGNGGADEIWLNDGRGSFSLGQRFGRGTTTAVFLADLDGDGDLDIVISGSSSRVWLNNGTGQFSQGQRIRHGSYNAVTLGDVTGDGIVDIFVASVESYQVWRGEGNGRFSPDLRTDYR